MTCTIQTENLAAVDNDTLKRVIIGLLDTLRDEPQDIKNTPYNIAIPFRDRLADLKAMLESADKRMLDRAAKKTI